MYLPVKRQAWVSLFFHRPDNACCGTCFHGTKSVESTVPFRRCVHFHE